MIGSYTVHADDTHPFSLQDDPQQMHGTRRIDITRTEKRSFWFAAFPYLIVAKVQLYPKDKACTKDLFSMINANANGLPALRELQFELRSRPSS